MRWADIDFAPSPTKLRQFAGAWLVFFLAWAAWLAFQRHPSTAPLVLAGLALSLGPLGLVAPRLMRPIFVGWSVLAFPIGFVVSRLLLAVVFYGLLTPMAWLFRLIGRDALRRGRRHADDTSYWLARAAPKDVRRYFRQF